MIKFIQTKYGAYLVKPSKNQRLTNLGIVYGQLIHLKCILTISENKQHRPVRTKTYLELVNKPLPVCHQKDILTARDATAFEIKLFNDYFPLDKKKSLTMDQQQELADFKQYLTDHFLTVNDLRPANEVKQMSLL